MDLGVPGIRDFRALGSTVSGFKGLWVQGLEFRGFGAQALRVWDVLTRPADQVAPQEFLWCGI